MPEKVAHFARLERVIDVEQAFAIVVDEGAEARAVEGVREELGVVEGVGHWQVGAEALRAVRIQHGITRPEAVDGEADHALIGSKGVDEQTVDEKYSAQIYPEPHAAVLPTLAAER